MEVDLVIARHINGTTVVQGCVKNGNSIVLCHVDLIEDSESSVFCALVDGSFAEFYFIIYKGVCSDQVSAVCIYMERNVICRTVENLCQVLCKDVLSCGFGAGE